MAIYEESEKEAEARSAKNLCVYSTSEDEVTGTALIGTSKWSEQYPLLCPDYADVWMITIVMKARRMPHTTSRLLIGSFPIVKS